MTSGCWSGWRGRAPRLRRDPPCPWPTAGTPAPPAPPPWPTGGATSRPASRLSPASGATRRDGPGLGLCGRGAGPHLPGRRQRRGGGARRNRPGRSCPGPGPAQPPHHRGRSPDTYAKAILCDSPVYFSMVLPEAERECVWQAGLAPHHEVELEDAGHPPSTNWASTGTALLAGGVGSVMNLLPDGAEGYTGTLFFLPLSEDNTYGIVYQQVAVRPDGTSGQWSRWGI